MKTKFWYKVPHLKDLLSRLTITPNLVNTGPDYINTLGSNYIRCQVFTATGRLQTDQNPNQNNMGGGVTSSMQVNTAGVDLGPGTSITGSGQSFLLTAPASGAQRLNQQYYVACMSFTVASNIATNVNMDNALSVT